MTTEVHHYKSLKCGPPDTDKRLCLKCVHVRVCCMHMDLMGFVEALDDDISPAEAMTRFSQVLAHMCPNFVQGDEDQEVDFGD